jgi:hypothetical protein
MTVNWHFVSFVHPSCGKEGALLQIAVRADGVFSLHGYCEDCEQEFSELFVMSHIVAVSAIKDYEEERRGGGDSYDLSGDFVPSGLPA